VMVDQNDGSERTLEEGTAEAAASELVAEVEGVFLGRVRD